MAITRAATVRGATLLGVVAAITLTACTPSSSDQKMSMTTSGGSTITISKYKYTVPKSVKPGQKITVKNDDSVAHTVTSKTGHAFDSKVDANATSTFTAPAKAGSYKFTCTYHTYMNATLVVK